MLTKFILVSCLAFASLAVQAELKVVATTTTLADLVKQVGGDRVEIHSITKYGQDPHFVEAKPSYTLKLRNADLLVSVGLELEIGWIELIRRGARNPRIAKSTRGDFESGKFIDALEVVEGKVDRSKGDVHPEGNPHFHFDPDRYLKVAEALARRLAELEPESKPYFFRNYAKLERGLKKKSKAWEKRVQKAGVKGVVTYHKSYTYFLNRFDLQGLGYLEPHPGVSPTAKHIVALINKIKSVGKVCIFNENYFEETAARRVQKSTGAFVISTPIEVKSSYDDLIESMVKAVERCSEATS